MVLFSICSLRYRRWLTAVVLLLLARERGVDEPMLLAVATIWLISPFSLTWAFHYSSYLMLPFKLVVVTAWVHTRVANSQQAIEGFVAKWPNVDPDRQHRSLKKLNG